MQLTFFTSFSKSVAFDNLAQHREEKTGNRRSVAFITTKWSHMKISTTDFLVTSRRKAVAHLML